MTRGRGAQVKVSLGGGEPSCAWLLGTWGARLGSVPQGTRLCLCMLYHVFRDWPRCCGDQGLTLCTMFCALVSACWCESMLA